MGLVGKFTGSQEFLSGDVPRWSRKRLIWPKELAVLRYEAKQNWESRDSVFFWITKWMRMMCPTGWSFQHFQLPWIIRRSLGHWGSSSLKWRDVLAETRHIFIAAKLKPPPHGGQSKGLGPMSPNGTKSYWLILVRVRQCYFAAFSHQKSRSPNMSAPNLAQISSTKAQPVARSFFFMKSQSSTWCFSLKDQDLSLAATKTHELPSLGLKDYWMQECQMQIVNFCKQQLVGRTLNGPGELAIDSCHTSRNLNGVTVKMVKILYSLLHSFSVSCPNSEVIEKPWETIYAH